LVLDNLMISFLAVAIRVTIAFASLDNRYGITLKLLKHPPHFRLPTLGSVDDEESGMFYLSISLQLSRAYEC